ncbi:hypothetical protein NPIL_177111 [Nephila pilipes]|uniref:Uncharacterized protein n=1 Tax=Nephila pilipes TaxID=299642 RepID=A0A8X6MSE1_NEPPI|nr:hypothetical protein NPIL_177111 [Nephila pilipes]
MQLVTPLNRSSRNWGTARDRYRALLAMANEMKLNITPPHVLQLLESTPINISPSTLQIVSWMHFYSPKEKSKEINKDAGVPFTITYTFKWTCFSI